SNLKDIIETGTPLDALISASLIENVFEPGTPLHDGAMILSGNRAVAAGCFLPLSENNTLEKTLGTRHRAALGMSEHSDAVVIVISEETGVISCAKQGVFRRYLDLESLRVLLTDLYTAEAALPKTLTAKLFARFFGKEDGPHAEA
ncbi:MAG: DNA integrity scanning protein DisA nucleotide-binding domain protein, partial [Clostridia bacterium]|nr:DNA integrity scanning protein DisA nucleotide-binding domain protein [Clostridia bacterium]